jgi:NitT/TauT family transport system substrate-binding protein
MEKTWMQVGALNYDNPLPQKQYVDTSFADKVETGQQKK